MDAVTRLLLDAYDARRLIEPITSGRPHFGMDAAYEVLSAIETERRTRGWRPVGRKIGFTNHTLWERYGVGGPMWARVWDRTVTFAAGRPVSVDLESFVQPRLEPEVVFGLRRSPPASEDPSDVLACVEWMAAGFEIVQCHFPDWKFTAADCTASFGLHAALVVGRPVAVSEASASSLAAFEVSLSRDGEVIDRGAGANVLGSPALALVQLIRTLESQPQFEPLAAGEIVTTGTLTDAWPVASGQRWTSDYGSLGVEGLEVSFRSGWAG